MLIWELGMKKLFDLGPGIPIVLISVFKQLTVI